MPIAIMAGVALFRVLTWPKGAVWVALHDVIVPLVVLVGCIVATLKTYESGSFEAVHINSWRFAIGRYSLDTAYTTQGGWPGRLPWGGIYPGARGAYKIVGPHTKVWTFHVHSYCMLPDCELETNVSFVMARDIDRLLFGTGEEGRLVLQQAGVNYFLFSKELSLTDFVQRSALFSPENISRYLGVRWTDGTTTLLTWLGPDTKPLDEVWIAEYRRAIEASQQNPHFYETLKRIFTELRAKPHPWHSFELPWQGNRPY